MNLFRQYLEQISRMQRSFHDVSLHDFRADLSGQLKKQLHDSMFDEISNAVYGSRSSVSSSNIVNNILKKYKIDDEVWISSIKNSMISYVVRKR